MSSHILSYTLIYSHMFWWILKYFYIWYTLIYSYVFSYTICALFSYHRMYSLTAECVLLLKNVFAYHKMSSHVLSNGAAPTATPPTKEPAPAAAASTSAPPPAPVADSTPGHPARARVWWQFIHARTHTHTRTHSHIHTHAHTNTHTLCVCVVVCMCVRW